MSLRKLLPIILALILPLQGYAAAFMPAHLALNSGAAAAAAAMPCHEKPGVQGMAHDATQTADHDGNHAPSPDAPRDADAANHLCCHQVFNCAPACAPAAPSQKFSDVTRAVLPLATLYIPDSPDRPPRG